jgi:hypothetical protein
MTRQRLIQLTAVLFVIGVGIDLVIGYSPIPGYGALIGLVGAFVLTYGAKGLGSAFVVRSEDLYPDEIPPDVAPDLPVAPGADIDAWPDEPVKAEHHSSEAAAHGRSAATDHHDAEVTDPDRGEAAAHHDVEAADPATPRASDAGPDHDRGAGRD